MQDPISTLKLYPKKSNNLVTTSVNTQFHVAKELVDHTLGFEIQMDLYYDPATLSTSNHNAACGRGNNTGFPSGMFLPGVFGTGVFFGKWKEGPWSQISKTGLTADWYRYKMIVTATTVQIKLLNLRTNVELSGNIAAVGTSTVGEGVDYTFLCYGIDGSTGAYGSVGVNYSNIKILRGSTCLLNVPLSEGADTKVTDICNSSQYQLSFFTAASGWAKLSNYFHYNFRYGFTLYQKSGSADLRIPNTANQTEISITPPSGYVRIANYKECRTSFNQCESKFKLDDVAEVSRDVLAVCPDTFYNGLYVRQNDELYICTANNSEISISGGTWRFRNRTTYAIPYTITRTWPLINPALENWSVVGVTCSNPVVFSNQDLYDADVDHVLFTANTGVAKEINVGTLDVDLGFNRGYMYINPNIQEHDFMLYATNKTLKDDEKILKYIGLGDEILTDDETGETIVDENDHVILEG